MFIALSFVIALLTHTTPAPRLQDKVLTPIDEQELVLVLEQTHTEVFGHPASKGRIAVAWGQIAFENGRGKLAFNHNLGNIGPFRGYPYYKHGLSAFRSFTDFHEGAKVYWELLRDRCSAALASFDAMNAMDTAAKLRRCGYHRTEVEIYAKNLGSLTWTGYKLL